ncbi:MAG: hypothetical protein ACI8Z5_002411 [Lentimonas sp.]|jgi:hypothetical protein
MRGCYFTPVVKVKSHDRLAGVGRFSDFTSWSSAVYVALVALQFPVRTDAEEVDGVVFISAGDLASKWAAVDV